MSEFYRRFVSSAVCVVVHFPAAGPNVGLAAGAAIVKVAVASLFVEHPLAIAMAFTVIVLFTVRLFN